MALIKCPECGKQISDKSDVCIGCGCPINTHNRVFSGEYGLPSDAEIALMINDLEKELRKVYAPMPPIQLYPY